MSMLNVSYFLGNNLAYPWRCECVSEDVQVRWIGHLSGEECSRFVIAAQADSENRTQMLSQILARTRSFFAVVIETHDSLILVADHAASFPLYYSCNAARISAGDAASACSQIGEADMLGVLEFTRGMAPVGTRTLWHDVREVRNGSFVIINKAFGTCDENVYWRFRRSFPAEGREVGDFDAMVESVFGRTAVAIQGKTTVLPITSGLDSRTIAVYLREFGVEDVIAFSVGKCDSADVLVGKAVAKGLGIPWHHVEITGKQWRDYWGSEEYRAASQYNSEGGRTFHALMHHALLRLEEEGAIPKDAVFMPGHAGSFMGGELRFRVLPKRSHSLSWVVDSMYNYDMHLSFATSRNSKGIREDLQRELRRFEPSATRWSPMDYLADTDAVHVTQGVFKFLQNDVRNYEFFGYKWYLPLMDRQWCDYWALQPFEDCLSKRRMAMRLNEKTSGFLAPYEPVAPDCLGLRKTLRLMPRLQRLLARRGVWEKRLPSIKNTPVGYFDDFTLDEYLVLCRRRPGSSTPLNSAIIDDAIRFYSETGKLKLPANSCMPEGIV